MCPDWEIKRPEKCSNTVERKGKTVYFCTKRCKEKFVRNESKAKSARKTRAS
jgi:YHS domain-containing protein